LNKKQVCQAILEAPLEPTKDLFAYTKNIMSAMRVSAARLSTLPARTALPSARRAFASEPPRSQSPPARPKAAGSNEIYIYVGIGLGIGGIFAFMMGRPSKAGDVAKTTSSLPGKDDLKGRDHKH